MTYKDLTISVNLNAQITAEERDAGQTVISIHWNEMTAEKPMLTVAWQRPLVDIQYEWYPHCRFKRALHVDWNDVEKTKISSSAPVFCFYNAAGRNRFTVALSDAKTLIGFNLGVHEEDGTLLCRIEIPLDATGLTHDYSVTLYRDDSDISFAESLRRVSAWWETVCGFVPAPVPNAAREPLYSCWYSFHQANIASEIEAECARAARLGMKVVIVDDGWQTDDGNRGYAFCGDWAVTPNKIPDMRAHVANIHALGMKYILWYSVPFVGFQSKVWNRFQGKLLQRIERIGAGVLDPRYPDVRKYLIDVYQKALLDWDLDGFKLDFIDSISSGNNPVPPVTPEMDYVLVEDAVERLMTDVMQTLRAIKPDIMIEFRQSYIGPVMRTFGNMLRVGDCPDDALSNRVGIVDLRLLSGNTAVHSDMLMWHEDDTPEAVARQILSIVFGVPQISVKLDRLCAEHRQLLTFWLSFMREHRATLQHAPLEVKSPENLYAQVKAERDGKAIIALYSGGQIVDMPESRDVWLLNASSDRRVVLDVKEERALHIEVNDCLGNPVRAYDACVSGMLLLDVPECGAVHVTNA